MYQITLKKLTEPLDATWKPIDLSAVPATNAKDYMDRMNALWSMKQSKAYSCIVIYADREHYSNIHYFTGYDPRFEEALLVLYRDKRLPVLVVGNENMPYTESIPYPVVRILYQTFSLMGQPNESSLNLAEIAASLHLPEEGKVGLIGWKSYDSEKVGINDIVTDFPAYILEAIKTVVPVERLGNATDLLTDPEYGLKHHLSAKEIVQFEAVGTVVSRNVYQGLKKIKPGMTEMEASKELGLDGHPLAIHPNLNFGDENLSKGLNSPMYYDRLAYGASCGIGYGLRGSLVHKSGIYARDENDIPEEKKGYLEEFVKPYFASIVRWYEMMRIGTLCGDIWQMVEDWIGFDKFGIGLNPGHMTHTDEWTHSPFEKGSTVKIDSGMGLQCDYTVTFKNPYMSCHIEDGLVIANADLRNEVRELSPEAWKRIEARRKMMKDILNIDLPDEVLPLSDLSAVCFPYMADMETVLAKA